MDFIHICHLTLLLKGSALFIQTLACANYPIILAHSANISSAIVNKAPLNNRILSYAFNL